MNDSTPHPKRRWLQFSLKSLLMVFLLVAAFWGGRSSVLMEVERARVEADRQQRLAEQNLIRAVDAAYQASLQAAMVEMQDTSDEQMRRILEQSRAMHAESSEQPIEPPDSH